MVAVSHDSWSRALHSVYTALVVNMLVLVATLPLVVLLMTTNPRLSWPVLALMTPLAAPALTAAFSVFAAPVIGAKNIARAFVAGWRATWLKAMSIGGLFAGVCVVLWADIRFASDLELAVLIVPVLMILVLIASATAWLSLVSFTERPDAAVWAVVKAAIYLSMRHWVLALLSLAALAVQFVLFVTVPAVAIGVTCTPALYFAWTNARHSARAVLPPKEVVA